MWYRDLCSSVELLSEASSRQHEKMDNWQTDSAAITQRFQFEWEEFKRLHIEPVPLMVAERLDWLARLIERLPRDADINDERWAEIRATARELLPAMRPWF